MIPVLTASDLWFAETHHTASRLRRLECDRKTRQNWESRNEAAGKPTRPPPQSASPLSTPHPSVNLPSCYVLDVAYSFGELCEYRYKTPIETDEMDFLASSTGPEGGGEEGGGEGDEGEGSVMVTGLMKKVKDEVCEVKAAVISAYKLSLAKRKASEVKRESETNSEVDGDGSDVKKPVEVSEKNKSAELRESEGDKGESGEVSEADPNVCFLEISSTHDLPVELAFPFTEFMRPLGVDGYVIHRHSEVSPDFDSDFKGSRPTGRITNTGMEDIPVPPQPCSGWIFEKESVQPHQKKMKRAFVSSVARRHSAPTSQDKSPPISRADPFPVVRAVPLPELTPITTTVVPPALSEEVAGDESTAAPTAPTVFEKFKSEIYTDLDFDDMEVVPKKKKIQPVSEEDVVVASTEITENEVNRREEVSEEMEGGAPTVDPSVGGDATLIKEEESDKLISTSFTSTAIASQSVSPPSNEVNSSTSAALGHIPIKLEEVGEPPSSELPPYSPDQPHLSLITIDTSMNHVETGSVHAYPDCTNATNPRLEEVRDSIVMVKREDTDDCSTSLTGSTPLAATTSSFTAPTLNELATLTADSLSALGKTQEQVELEARKATAHIPYIPPLSPDSSSSSSDSDSDSSSSSSGSDSGDSGERQTKGNLKRETGEGTSEVPASEESHPTQDASSSAALSGVVVKTENSPLPLEPTTTAISSPTLTHSLPHPQKTTPLLSDSTSVEERPPLSSLNSTRSVRKQKGRVSVHDKQTFANDNLKRAFGFPRRTGISQDINPPPPSSPPTPKPNTATRVMGELLGWRKVSWTKNPENPHELRARIRDFMEKNRIRSPLIELPGLPPKDVSCVGFIYADPISKLRPITREVGEVEIRGKVDLVAVCTMALTLLSPGGDLVLRLSTSLTRFTSNIVQLLSQAFQDIAFYRPPSTPHWTQERMLLCRSMVADCSVRYYLQHVFNQQDVHLIVEMLSPKIYTTPPFLKWINYENDALADAQHRDNLTHIPDSLSDSCINTPEKWVWGVVPVDRSKSVREIMRDVYKRLPLGFE
eukprot:GHVN01095894.1.p1 GENE.GHVN01095894.1~~GHVN01095894.1.p1  ORF type:complete len:1121 (-),score=331.68 GHVN01095894.1:652-3798(-)